MNQFEVFDLFPLPVHRKDELNRLIEAYLQQARDLRSGSPSLADCFNEQLQNAKFVQKNRKIQTLSHLEIDSTLDFLDVKLKPQKLQSYKDLSNQELRETIHWKQNIEKILHLTSNRPRSTYGHRNSISSIRDPVETKLKCEKISLIPILKHWPATSMVHSNNNIFSKFRKCELTLKYIGFRRKFEEQALAREISVFQQPNPRSSCCNQLFRQHLKVGENFLLKIGEHVKNYFSITLFIDGIRDFRVNACCLYKHRINSRIGHFEIIQIIGGLPCDLCVRALSIQEREPSLYLNKILDERKKPKKILNPNVPNVTKSTKNHTLRSDAFECAVEAEDEEIRSLIEFEKIENELQKGHSVLIQEFTPPSTNHIDDSDDFESYESSDQSSDHSDLCEMDENKDKISFLKSNIIKSSKIEKKNAHNNFITKEDK